MIVINFWGGAGIGKSTLAARTYTWLKQRGCRVEMTGEYAKELVYEDSMRVIHDQLYLYAEQEHRLRCLAESGVEVAVCDSPTPLSVVYDTEQDGKLAELIWDRFDRYKSVNFLLKRDDSIFTEKDRIDTLESAHAVDEAVEKMLDEHKIPYVEVDMKLLNAFCTVDKVLSAVFSIAPEKPHEKKG